MGRIDIAYWLCGATMDTAAMLCGTALFDHVDNLDRANPTQLISTLAPFTDQIDSTRFSLGLFNAGWLAQLRQII